MRIKYAVYEHLIRMLQIEQISLSTAKKTVHYTIWKIIYTYIYIRNTRMQQNTKPVITSFQLRERIFNECFNFEH